MPTSAKLGSWLARIACAAVAIGTFGTARADDRLTVLTTWFAQAEHGGLYQAAATGIYKKYGLDVTVKSGGPQVNGIQLLLAGQADFIMNYDFAVLQGVERGFPLVTVGAPFQFDMQGVMTHADVKGLGDLKGKTILVAGTGTTYWWPWLKAKYHYGDEQMRPYTFNLQPFFADPNIAQQAFASSEPFQAMQKGVKANFFLLADDGYPPYTGAITTTQETVAKRPDIVARFVKATMEGWKSYLENPAPGNEIIKKENPNMTDGQIAYGIEKMKEMKVITGGEAARSGIGAMSDERWKKTANFMRSYGLLKSDTDYRKAYTLQFIKDVHVMP